VQPTITVDIGTTSVKLCFFDASGQLRASARHATPTVADAWGEIYDLETLLGGIIEFIRNLDAEARSSVARIAVTGVGESGGLVRPDLTLSSPMILWHDHRGADYLAPLGPADRELIYRVAGLPVNANYGLSKVAWAVANAPSAQDGAQWLNIAEYLAAILTGSRFAEYSLASRTMALDIASGQWSAEVCALVGLDVRVFPQLRAAGHGDVITAARSQDLGLPKDVMVHVAGHDHMVGAVGAGLRAGELLNSTGTTEGLLFLRDQPRLDNDAAQSKLANGVACMGEGYTLFASIPTGGSAFATLQSMLGIDGVKLSARLAGLHERYLAGSLDPRTTPLVLPRFRGSPPPTKDAKDRGVIAGLRSDTTADELVFGTFLGMVLQFSDVLELFRIPPKKIKVIGPASGNPLWLQLKADLLGAQLSASQFPEVVSRGAQALASGQECDWEWCQPKDVLVDGARTARLAEWSADIRPQWEYLKGVPS
jgi:sugar (pentulose or hexulose) kinase